MRGVTVAAVILATDVAAALADADGVPAVRRIVDSAWSGGALPIVVVATDPEGRLAAALTGAAVILAEPEPGGRPSAGDDASHAGRGVEIAAARVSETNAALLWPVRMAWVGPETVTSLIEAHGSTPGAILRPTFRGDAGWPVLVPLQRNDPGPGAGATPFRADIAGALQPAPDHRHVELGDPGTSHDIGTARAALPPYEGPPEPASGHVHEWGAAIAEESEEDPLRGPALAPWGQAAASHPDQPA
jgi:CTP:molybdopterin cytidylyltransferase MocA